LEGDATARQRQKGPQGSDRRGSGSTSRHGQVLSSSSFNSTFQ
jgi:hypothetical protein